MSCHECFSGHKHSGDVQGTEAKLHGRDTYVSEPPMGTAVKGIVVIVPDAFGWKFVNNRILADHFAAQGYRTYIPEFMDGWAMHEAALWLLPAVLATNKGITNWLLKPLHAVRLIALAAPFLYKNGPAATWPKVRDWCALLRESQGPAERGLPIGAAGYCWGGKYAVRLVGSDALTAAGKPLVDAAFTAHPSKLDIPADVERVARPLSIAIGDRDVVLNEAGRKQVEAILDGKEGVQTEFVLFEGAGHGFALREDEGNENLLAQAVEAEKQALAWFDKHLRR